MGKVYGETGMVLGTGKERPLSVGLHTDGYPEARFESASLHQNTERKVVTSHVYPPIPCRDYDWTAWFDDVGQEGPAGWGRTEAEAKQDLLDNYGDE